MRHSYSLLPRFIALVAVLVGGCLCLRTNAGTVSCGVLQRQLDRLYFPRGEESLVLPGAAFTLICGNDTITAGYIEWSRPGISVSRPLLPELVRDSCAGATVLISTPDIDSTSAINLQIDPRLPWNYALVTTDSTADSLGEWQHTGAGNPVQMVGDEGDGSDGRADGEVTLQSSGRDYGRRDMTIPAPYIAALVPNLGKRMNSQGFLTTSAYYRFGDIHLPYVLPESELRRQDRFDRGDSADVRLYPYDPERGRGLIANMPDRPQIIRLSYLHPGLEAAARFFADVFARDRIKVEVVAMDTTADVMVAWLPFLVSDPSAGLQQLYGLMSRTETAQPAQKEALLLIEQYLRLARNATSTDARDYYLNLVDRSFKEDLGAFPLFRPFERIAPSARLRNVRADVDGRLVVSELILLSYPPANTPGSDE